MGSDELESISTLRNLTSRPGARTEASAHRPPYGSWAAASPLYVRSWRGTRGAWWSTVQATHTASINVGGVRSEVTLTRESDPAANDCIDGPTVPYTAACPSYVEPMVSEHGTRHPAAAHPTAVSPAIPPPCPVAHRLQGPTESPDTRRRPEANPGALRACGRSEGGNDRDSQSAHSAPTLDEWTTIVKLVHSLRVAAIKSPQSTPDCPSSVTAG
ncbi:DUF2255 family protein [Streptomyces arenae]|uniref:DUF2255 family protein n=1 Tax=Streptomyces arenae TaxID=29301 RepID=UPI00265A66D4|nr:DUF2255 family protein [Streptomyces arenae]MCG7202273.1 DUF2255 family protein [Streptomyces arenae]